MMLEGASPPRLVVRTAIATFAGGAFVSSAVVALIAHCVIGSSTISDEPAVDIAAFAAARRLNVSGS